MALAHAGLEQRKRILPSAFDSSKARIDELCMSHQQLHDFASTKGLKRKHVGKMKLSSLKGR